MRDFRDAKAMAHTLREALKAKSISVTHGESLELVAKILGLHDWNVLSARIQAGQPSVAESGEARSTALPSLSQGIPLPIVPLRDIVFFPKMVAPLFVGRASTKRAIESALAGSRTVLAITQRRCGDNDPKHGDLHDMGVIANVIHQMTLRDGTLKVVISGLERANIVRPVESDFLAAEVAPVADTRAEFSEETLALSRAVLDAYQAFASTRSLILRSYAAEFRGCATEPGQLADAIAPLLKGSIGIQKVQQLLETTDVAKRLEMILELTKVSRQAA